MKVSFYLVFKNYNDIPSVLRGVAGNYDMRELRVGWMECVVGGD